MKRTSVWAVVEFFVLLSFIAVVWPLSLWRYCVAVALLLAMEWAESSYWRAYLDSLRSER